jgi:integrase
MASIRRRGPAQYQVRVAKKGYPAQVRTLRTKLEAEEWALTTELEMAKGVFISKALAETMTLGDALGKYLRQITPHKKSADSEANLIRRLKKNYLAARSMDSVMPHDLAQYRDSRLEVVSPRTVQWELALYSHLFNIAIREWGMPYLDNPVAKVGKPRVRNARSRRLAGDEEARIIDASPKWLRDILLFALETGCRRGEIVKLLWEDVDLEAHTALLRDPKSGSDRAVPLSVAAKGVLASTSKSGPSVFPVKPDAITKKFATLCLELGIEGLTFHDLRHEATSRLFEKGFNTMEVASITGHKTLTMLRRYTHLAASDLARRLD